MSNEQYRDLFVSESEEHLQMLNQAILQLEKDPANSEVLNTIFRSAHTLKGMSATMGYEALTKLTHRMEDLLDIFRRQAAAVTPEVVDILFRCLDMLEMLLEEIKTGRNLNVDADAMILQLESVIPSLIRGPGAAETAEEKTAIGLTRLEKENLAGVLKDGKVKMYLVRVCLAADCQLKSVRVFMVFNKLGGLGEVIKTRPASEDLELNKFGRWFSVLFISKTAKKKMIEEALKNIMEIERTEITALDSVESIADEEEKGAEPGGTRTAGAQALPVRGEDAAQKDFAQIGFKKIQSIRVSTKRLDKLMNVVGELVIAKIRIMQLAQTQRIQQLSEILTNIDRLTGELQDEVMQARLIPIAQVFDRFPRMVRDLARTSGKQINLVITGGEIELDRTVLDEIADPLVHLLRNSVDHGIEPPQERKNSGKNPVGTVRLNAVRERTFVLIEIIDDGRGIDHRVMRELAVRKGFMSEEEANKLSDKEALSIILLPGFSSSAKVTDTSGRGVGMDVVKTKIEALGGSMSFDSELGRGCSFHLKLPLTVAIIRAMLVVVREEIYATPIANIAETVKIRPEKIKRVEKLEVINLRGEVLPLVRLERFLGSKSIKSAPAGAEDGEISVVIVEMGSKKAGLVVDRLIGQQEVVIKSFGSMLKGIKGFAGATILGDGRVALILDVGTLVG